MNFNKNVVIISILFISIYCSYSQNTQYEIPSEYDLIFNGTSIDNAIEYETNINSKQERINGTIVLSTKLYPYVNRYDLDNPIQFSRNTTKNIPAFIEYYYDKNSKIIKYTNYKWAFFNKINDDILFNRKKLRELVEQECGELDYYTLLFNKLEGIMDIKYPSHKKSLKINQTKNKKIEWISDTSLIHLNLEFQDCNDQDKLLPGWFVINLIEYSK